MSKVTNTLRITTEQVLRFAAASGDYNPLHVDARYARHTPYGRPIAHGALVAIGALVACNPKRVRYARRIDLQFKQPVFPGEEYSASQLDGDLETTRLEVRGGGAVALSMTVATDAAGHAPQVPEQLPVALPETPHRSTIEELARGEGGATHPHACRVRELVELAAEVGASDVPEALLLWLAAASYTVGMLVPGRDAVFVGARITHSPAEASGSLSTTVQAADDRTGFVTVDAFLNQAAASAQMHLHAFLRPEVPRPDRASVGRHLRPSAELAGQNIMVVGASRGLGAALAAAFATQGATVWAGFDRSAEQADRLRSEFGAERIRPLHFDATDIGQTRRAFARVREHVDTLDGLALCAAPPLGSQLLDPDAADATLRFVAVSLAMGLVPVSEGSRLLSHNGWLAFMSSSALEDPPAPWPHYTIAKAALEGLAAYCARHLPARVLVVRAPKMWTDSTNTPLGRAGAAAPEQVAAAIARRVVGGVQEGHAGEPRVLAAAELLGNAEDAR